MQVKTVMDMTHLYQYGSKQAPVISPYMFLQVLWWLRYSSCQLCTYVVCSVYALLCIYAVCFAAPVLQG